MKIVSLNKNPERYGYLSEMEYKDPNFHGHQTALCIGVKNTDGSWNKVYTSGSTEEEKIKIANDILNDKSLIILEDKVFYVENNKLVPKTVYYFPYYVADHSVYQPTINFNQICYDDNINNDIKIEVLFVHDEGWYNRYIVFDVHTLGHYSLTDFVNCLAAKIKENAEDNKDFFIAKEDAENYLENDIVLDFYDSSGQKYFIGYPNAEYFLDLVSSVRIIDINTYKAGEIDNEN